MEHYDWNEGWLFAPTFDPALVRPECPELSLTPVRLPHTVKPLPYNYCNENDYQRLCGYRRLQEEVIVMYETTIQLNAINDVKDFVNKVMLFNYDIDLVSGRYAIDAKSIMGIFSLDLSKPIKLQAHTDDADKLVEAIGKYIVK